MTIQFHIHGLDDNAGLRRRLQQSLECLASHVPISAVAVIVEHERNNAPAFYAYCRLAVPGPHIHAEVRDHTLEAVWLRVMAALRSQVEQRKPRRDLRQKRNGQVRYANPMANRRRNQSVLRHRRIVL